MNDDTKGLKEINGPEDRDKLQRALANLEEWAEKWGMKFNIPKCKIMHVGAHNPGYKYTMSGLELAEVEEEMDIAVTVHRSLKPSKHCKKAAGTASAVLRQLARKFHYRDRNIFRKLYIQYVQPHLEFASPAWNPWLQEDKEILEKVQKKAVGMISGLAGRTYLERCAELGLETLEKRRETQDLLQLFKMVKEGDQQGQCELFKRNQRTTGATTRSSADPWNITVDRARLDIRRYEYSFAVRAPDIWNKLPSDIKAYDKAHLFKNAMKKTTPGIGGGPQAS